MKQELSLLESNIPSKRFFSWENHIKKLDYGIVESYKSTVSYKKEKCFFIEEDNSVLSFPIPENRILYTKSLYNLEIEKAISRSRELIKLKEGWDGEDALPCTALIWRRATNLLRTYANEIVSSYNVQISVPEINLGRDGSIDLEWRDFNKYILLINIRNSEEVDIHYYGEDFKNQNIIKGFIKSEEINKDLAFWMQKLV